VQYEDLEELVELQSIRLRHRGAHAALVALGSAKSTRTPTAPPALDATQQRPVDGLGSTQHIDIRIRGKVQSRKHVGDDEELIRCGQTIWGYGQRDSNLKKEYKKHFNFKINIVFKGFLRHLKFTYFFAYFLESEGFTFLRRVNQFPIFRA